MTHEELVERFTITKDYTPAQDYDYSTFLNIILAVLEIHKPEPLDERGDVCLACCPDLLTLYPCPTIQAIEKELE